MKRPPLALATLGLTAAFVLAAGSGVAIGSGIQMVDSAGQITACVKASNGDVRVASSAASCKREEMPLTWQQGGGQSAGGPAAYRYLRTEATVPATDTMASEDTTVAAPCPTVTAIVDGSVESLTYNAFWNPASERLTKLQDGRTALVFNARHVGRDGQGYGADPTVDAVAVVNLVCAVGARAE